MIHWDDRYKTGEERLDRHHRMLFEFINDFGTEINEGRGRKYLENSLKFVEYYIGCHFSIEEICMDRFKCPFAQKNAQAHKIFTDGIETFKNEIKAEGYTDAIAVRMHQFFENWITGHIVAIDTKLNAVLPNT